MNKSCQKRFAKPRLCLPKCQNVHVSKPVQLLRLLTRLGCEVDTVIREQGEILPGGIPSTSTPFVVGNLRYNTFRHGEGPDIYLREYMQNLNFKLLAVVFFLLPLPFLSGCALVAATGIAAGTGVAISEDRRTSGTMVQDESIEFKSNQRIKEKFGRKVHVEVTSFNRHVLLTGETTSARVKNEIEDIVGVVEGVRDVTNKITVGEVRPLTARSHDAFITSKVKAKFVNEGTFQANHVKVVTEDGVVYLLGLVDREEAQNALKVAKSTNGVRKVVQVFEYLD